MNYLQARRAYLDWYSHMTSPPDPDDVAHDAYGVLELLAARLEGFNLAAEEFFQATQGFLAAPEASQRLAALDSLLGQMEGDLEIATCIWAIIGQAEANQDEAAIEGLVMQAIREHRLDQTLRRLALDLPADISSSPPGRSAPERRPALLDEALEDLRLEVGQTLALVNERTGALGLRMIRDVLNVSQSDELALEKAIELLQGTEKAGKVAWGLEDQVPPLCRILARHLRITLVNSVSRLLILMEKNDLVRYTMAGWLQDLRETAPAERPARFAFLLEQLYQTQSFQNHDLPLWLRDAGEVARVHQAAQAVQALGENFEAFSSHIRRLNASLTASDLLVNPHLMSVGLALHVGLLACFIFAGYDYLDEGARALNLTQGVKEVLINTLPVSEHTRLEAELRRSHRIR